MKIVFPEIAQNSIAREAIQSFPAVEFLPAPDLAAAAELVASGQADSMISGLDYSSRDVLLAYKDYLPLTSAFFSSCFVCEKADRHYVLADGGVNKQPTTDQFYTIVEDSAATYQKYYDDQPRIALLSYSTHGSGGKNPDLEKIYTTIEKIRTDHPDWLIDGEMQLDAAILPEVSAKKFPDSQVAGHANVLITPDLNSGNLMYKTLEHLGGWTCAGPLIQGFKMPLADLSRGSTVEDIILTLQVLIKLVERTKS